MLCWLLQAMDMAEQAKQRTAEAVQYGKETVDQTADQVMQCQPANPVAFLRSPPSTVAKLNCRQQVSAHSRPHLLSHGSGASFKQACLLAVAHLTPGCRAMPAAIKVPKRMP